jgi:hypothetical protein
MVNAAITLPKGGNFFPFCRRWKLDAVSSPLRNPRISAPFALFSKKATLSLKAFPAAPLSPFEAASSLKAAT